MTPMLKQFLTVRLVVLAVGVIAVAGIAALYVTKGASVQTDNGVCAVNPALKAQIKAKAVGEMAPFRVAMQGQKMPDLAFVDGQNQPVRLQDMQGKVLLVNLWATWCAPCRKEMPSLDRLMHARHGAGFSVVTVSVDMKPLEVPQKFFDETAIKHLALYHDKSGESMQSVRRAGLGAGLPATVLVDVRGCVLGSLNGPADWNSREALALIDAAILQ